MSNYEPGTVAKVTNAGKEVLAFRVGWPAPDWMSADVGTLHAITDVRPLVVLDMSTSDLRCLTENIRARAAHMEDINAPNTALLLRAAADQIEEQIRPPKPPEPRGLGAVVEDADGDVWVKVPLASNERDWFSRDTGDWRGYADIDAVRKLSDGWEPRHD